MYNLQNKTLSEVNSIVTMSEGTDTNKKKGLIYVLIGWTFFAISLIFLPIIFGSIAIFMSIMTYFERSEAHGTVLMIFAVMGLILGSIFNFFVTGTLFI
ncbi:hypothetical protein [Neobacillus sp. PS3-40]|jgi:hypothetical protein|uniref:hypothetical protein n=1 Tax=Neobacillus sp. PS3-40 TaxID=3070679 RepID=UPI0027DF18BD|nr:hypothetical protein [Neobacillus sp. PS3-40]WML43985.1 hypothetical protein RCG20_19730 [Neobacillus sp. PS3-40]